MAANPTDLEPPASVSDIRRDRRSGREAQASDEKRMIAALEDISDTAEAIRQEIVHFERLVERLLLAPRLP